MSTLESILDNHLSAPTSNVEQTVFRALKRLESDPRHQHVGYLQSLGQQFQFLQFLKSEGVEVSVETNDLHESMWWNAGALMNVGCFEDDGEDEDEDDGEDTADNSKGTLVRQIQTGILHFEYQGTKFKVYQVSWTNNHSPMVLYDFIFMHDYESEALPASDSDLLYNYIPKNTRNRATAHFRTPAHRLISAAHAWSFALKSEIWVFQNGGWFKDKSLYSAISKASWSDLTLAPEFLDGLRKDTRTFFASREIYKELGVTWKRGLLMMGPPGNGKTESIKVLLRESGQTALYVRSFTTSCGPENGVRAIFSHARAHAPCILVIEDLDSLVTPEVRSFFLNELDGLAQNDGVLTIATTNHPELIDDAILNRPSRFDVKYTFELPNEALRKEYIEKWIAKVKAVSSGTSTGQEANSAEGKKSATAGIKVSFVDESKTAGEVAKKTDGWSFAFLKELFVSFLLRIAHDKADQAHSQSESMFSGWTNRSLDSVLLDQVDKLAVQILHSGEEGKSPNTGGMRGFRPPTIIGPYSSYGGVPRMVIPGMSGNPFVQVPPLL